MDSYDGHIWGLGYVQIPNMELNYPYTSTTEYAKPDLGTMVELGVSPRQLQSPRDDEENV